MTHWKPDYSHTQIMFSVKHMMISTVRGQFDKFTIDADINEQDVAKSSLTVVIDPASINTKFEQRDAHLKSPDFFHTDVHPEIVFKSTKGVHISDTHGKLIGELTIKGVTRPLELDVNFLGRVKTPWGTESAGFSAKGKINRAEWGLTWNAVLEAGGMMVGEDILLDVEAEFTKPVVQPAAVDSTKPVAQPAVA